MGVSVTVDLSQMKKITRVIEAAAKMVSPEGLKTTLQVAGSYAQSVSAKAFDNQWNPVTHNPWVELRAATLARRRKNGRGSKILQDTVVMFKSVTARKPFVSGNTVSIGAKPPYSIFHMTGTRYMPQRIFLGLGQAEKKELANIIANSLMAEIRKARG